MARRATSGPAGACYTRSVVRPCLFVLAFGGLLLSGSGVAAQDAGVGSCDGEPLRKPVLVIPIVGSRQVTTDAPLRVRYSPDYFGPGGPGGEPATLVSVQRCAADGCDPLSCEEGGDFVPGRIHRLGEELVFQPDGGWEANATYAGVARGRDGDLPFQFCTGSAEDDAPPSFGAIDDVSSMEVDPRCDAPEGGYRIAVRFDPASDPGGPPGSVEYLLYQTRGEGIHGPVVRARSENFSTTGQITMAFVLPPDEATSTICVRVAAVDGVGNVTLSQQPDGGLVCVEPVQGNFFEPLCAVRAPGAGRGATLALAGLGVVTLLVVRRRRG